MWLYSGVLGGALTWAPKAEPKKGWGAESLLEGESRSEIVQRGVGLHLGGVSELSAQAVHTMPGLLQGPSCGLARGGQEVGGCPWG